MTGSNLAFIAIGSNLGDRLSFIQSAVDDLDRSADIEVLAMSDVIETAAVGISTQPPFLNAAVAIRTTLSPRALLERCLHIETKHGRIRTADHRWQSRTLDLDVLLFGSLTIDEHGLQVPHPRLAERAFVLVPLAQVAPNHMHPVYQSTIADLLAGLQANTSVEYKVIAAGFEKTASSIEPS